MEDREVSLEDGGAIGSLSVSMAATGIIFRETDPDYDYDWHPVPQRHFIITTDKSVRKTLLVTLD